MINIIDAWTWEKPTEEGLYLICFGDVETPDNIGLFDVFELDGELQARPKDGFRFCQFMSLSEYSKYSKSYKFAKLEFK